MSVVNLYSLVKLFVQFDGTVLYLKFINFSWTFWNASENAVFNIDWIKSVFFRNFYSIIFKTTMQRILLVFKCFTCFIFSFFVLSYISYGTFYRLSDILLYLGFYHVFYTIRLICFFDILI